MKKKIRIFLKKYGADYIIGTNVSVSFFIAVSLVSVIFLLLLNYCFNIVEGLLIVFVIIFGSLLPTIILIISNGNDNDSMLVDIKTTMELLKIHIHAGVYVIDALDNCSDFMKNNRYKKALLKMTNDIYMSKNVTEALEEFNDSFNNPHIDTLVIILKQSLESGYSLSCLDSAFEQIIDVEKAINIKLENSVERNVQILQVLIMAGIIGISVFCSVVEFKGLFDVF